MTAQYRVLMGIDYGKGKRAEPGDVVSDLPKGQITNLRALGAIEPVNAHEEGE